MPLPRKDSPSSSRSRRGAREVCFAQTARGPGPLGKMLSAALALANAVQFSACSRVLSVLGPARAGPSERVFCSRFFCLRVFCQKDLIRSLGRPPDLWELGGGRECGASSLPSPPLSGALPPRRAPPLPPSPPSSRRAARTGAARCRALAAASSPQEARRRRAPTARPRGGHGAVLAGAGPCLGRAGPGGGRICAGALGGRATTYDAPFPCCCSSIGGGC